MRILFAGLAAFDLVLGVTAAFLPGLYLAVLHPRFGGGPTYWLTRTGLLWLFFAAVEGLAAWKPRPRLVFGVGLLRLMDVAADVGYLVTARDLGWFGAASLVFSPPFNLAIGSMLVWKSESRS